MRCPCAGFPLHCSTMPTFRMSLSRRAVLALPALAAFPAPLREALADTWPNKPVHIIVPFAPGGSGDITARLVGKYMEEKTGQPFVIDNKPGANGIVGVLSVKSSAADGYTLMLATTSTNRLHSAHWYRRSRRRATLGDGAKSWRNCLF